MLFALLPKTWADRGLYIEESFAPFRLVSIVQVACLRIIAGAGANCCCDCYGRRPDTLGGEVERGCCVKSNSNLRGTPLTSTGIPSTIHGLYVVCLRL